MVGETLWAVMDDVLIRAAVIIGALVGVVTGVGIIVHLRPVRWLARTLVGSPASHWFRAEVREAIAPDLEKIHRRIDSHMTEEEANGRAIVAAQVAVLRAYAGEDAARMFEQVLTAARAVPMTGGGRAA